MKIAEFLLFLAAIILAVVWFFNPQWNIEPLVTIILSLAALAGFLHIKNNTKGNAIKIKGNSNLVHQDVKTAENISEAEKANTISV
ncbi:MAG: hypothetical protein HY965_07830, partial [Ignavibacteriales bacterium]|nr:hypothetical protein [Ignavibacteriales bacterium]